MWRRRLIFIFILLFGNLWLMHEFYTSWFTTNSVKATCKFSEKILNSIRCSNFYINKLSNNRSNSAVIVNLSNSSDIMDEGDTSFAEKSAKRKSIISDSKDTNSKSSTNIDTFRHLAALSSAILPRRRAEKQLYDFIMKPAQDYCSDWPRVVIAVCSDVKNFERRQAIRETWASEYVKRTSKKRSLKDSSVEADGTRHAQVAKKKNSSRINQGSQRKNSSAPSPSDSLISDINSNLDNANNIVTSESNVNTILQTKSDADFVLFNQHLSSDRIFKITNSKLLSENENSGLSMTDIHNRDDTPYKNETSQHIVSRTLLDDINNATASDYLASNIHEDPSESSHRNPSRNESHDRGVNQTFNIRVIFVLARPHEQHAHLQNYVNDEFDNYGDVIQSDFIENYVNLTLKTLAAMRWTLENCQQARFLFKVDDDVYVGIENLIQLLTSSIVVESADNYGVIIGHVMSGAEPVRDRTSLHYTPWSVYREKVFPAYASGSGYVMSMAAVRKLYDFSLNRKGFFFLEDVYITGMLSRLLSIPLLHDSRFHFKREMHGARGACWYRDVITEHKLDAEYLQWLWIALSKLKTDTSNNKTTKCNLFD